MSKVEGGDNIEKDVEHLRGEVLLSGFIKKALLAKAQVFRCVDRCGNS